MRILKFFTLHAIIGPLPVNIMDGQIADANPVMANFNWIVAQVNQNSQALGLNPIFKLLTQSVSSQATAVIDNALFFGVAAGTYVFKAHVAFISQTACGFRFEMNGSAPISVGRYFYNGYWDSGSNIVYQSGFLLGGSWPAGPNFTPSTSTNGYVVIDGMVTTTGTGTVGFAWGQTTSNASVDQVIAGSYLEYALI